MTCQQERDMVSWMRDAHQQLRDVWDETQSESHRPAHEKMQHASSWGHPLPGEIPQPNTSR
jgi:hypothetical protein